MSDDETKQGELFSIKTLDISAGAWPVKDDLASMEWPIFSISKNKDTSIKEYRKGNAYIKIIPSTVGSATIFDKDLLIYIAGHFIDARNKGITVSRNIIIESNDFLEKTQRGDGRASFERIVDMLERLRGTSLQTNIETGGVMQIEGFGLIDSYRLTVKKERTEKTTDAKGKAVMRTIPRALKFEVTISDWLFNGLMNTEILTIDRKYFSLSSAIDRRLYEIARKHCGQQGIWKISIDLLAEKIGLLRERRKFKEDIKKLILADRLPEYRIALDNSTKPPFVVFYTRDTKVLSQELIKNNLAAWFQTLERKNQNRDLIS